MKIILILKYIIKLSSNLDMPDDSDWSSGLNN